MAQVKLYSMKQIILDIALIMIISLMIIGCGTGKGFLPDYRGYEREDVRTSIKRTPDWVESPQIIWYDNGAFYVIGKAFNRADIGFAESEGKAFAAKNIAEQIQVIFNSRFSLAMESEVEEVGSYSRLLLTMITQNIPLSIATTEVYWEQYRSPRGVRYDVYTLNRISEGSVRFAVSEAMRQIKKEINSPALRELLSEFEDEIVQGLK